MPRPDPVEQLRTLNELLARVSDPERSEHARRALEFFYREHPEDAAQVQLGSYVEKLARLHFGEGGEPASMGFSHWHVPQLEVFSALWIRQAIVGEMKKLAGRREALLLVTGLREAVCPRGKYWTQARQSEYERVRGWIEELACAWATRGSQLQVVVL
ncbi:hypothetical protein DDZ13_12695 [Coraliomargarita sinensis]|uniref:Uncharacterized protein n=1 Tax=Coraliomargarita sinensis TaxID=2174842 RepID=A0A317ZH38_9BACT|nr:hypothetical protein [Coraliomargarita sinensis]PXA03278.1 hypothetical protein DDZ13_12695 [Coraliomargarita sinensis]